MLPCATVRTRHFVKLISAPQQSQWRLTPHRTHSSRNASPNKQDANEEIPFSRLKGVTIVSGVNDAAHSLRNFIELGPGQPVAWSLQPLSPGSASEPSNASFTLSAYAGDDIDFGNGPHLFFRGRDGPEKRQIWSLLKEYFRDPLCAKVWLDYPSAFRILKACGAEVGGFVGDLDSMAQLMDKKVKSRSLDSLAKVTLKRTERTAINSILRENKLRVRASRPWKDLRQGGEQKLNDLWVGKACADARLIYRLFETLRDEMRLQAIHGHNCTYDFETKYYDAYSVYNAFFVPLIRQICNTQSLGVAARIDTLDSEDETLVDEINTRETRFVEWASSFSPEANLMNMHSTAQLRQLLFAPCVNIHSKTRVLPREQTFQNTKQNSDPESFLLCGRGANAVEFTATGWPSTSVKSLRKAAGYPRRAEPTFGQKDKEFCYAVDDLLVAKELRKNEPGQVEVKDIVVKDGRARIEIAMRSETGRLHAYFGNSGVKARGKNATFLKSGLCAGPGKTLIVGTYKDLDLWVLAQVSECEELLRRLGAESDPYELGAYDLFNSVRDSVEKRKCTFKLVGHSQALPLVSSFHRNEYDQARLLDLAIARGESEAGVMKKLGVARKDANLLLERWYSSNPGVGAWRKECLEKARADGFVETMLGRRRQFMPGKRGSRFAQEMAEKVILRHAVSGSAGEVMLGAFVNLGRHETLKALGWNIVFVDGDMVVLEGPQYSSDKAVPLVYATMRAPMDFELGIELNVELMTGESMENVTSRTEEEHSSTA